MRTVQELDKIKEHDWKQNDVIHCPNPNCHGMLLGNKFGYEYKCSDCNKYWHSHIEWYEIKEYEVHK